MDRDERWDRVETAYDLITQGKGQYEASNAIEGLKQAYERDENDEFVKPTVIGKSVSVEDGDAVFFMNFRADRAREITRAFVESDFAGFDRSVQPKLAGFVCLTQYAATIDAPSAFPPETLENVMGDWLAKKT